MALEGRDPLRLDFRAAGHLFGEDPLLGVDLDKYVKGERRRGLAGLAKGTANGKGQGNRGK